ncbi:hypothetical protein A3743_14760 [Oleiphilus sp. HI0072]|nr:hypothetical protein A3743_14760 [Oleiphilus sp. HI0072]
MRVATTQGHDALLYTLSLSQNLSADNARLLSEASRLDFVPGEVLLAFDQSSSAQGASTRSRSLDSLQRTLVERYGLEYSKRAGLSAELFRFDATVNSNLRVNSSTSWSKASKLERKWRTLVLLEELKALDGIEVAEPNYYRRATFVPNDSRYSEQWNLSLLKVEDAWNTATGDGVIVAVIDSGINPDHPDLRNQLTTSGYDFISDTEYSGDEDGFDDDPTDLSRVHHGSHVAGIVAAQSNNSEGISGVAFNSRVMALRVLGVENEDGVSQGTDADLANAIMYAGGLDNDSGELPSDPADVINLSLGGEGFSDTLKTAIDAVIAKGIIVIAAAGNESSSEKFYPAAFDGVTAVSSVTSELALSGFSNYGTYIDVAAPGGSSNEQSTIEGQQGIISTVSGAGYSEYLGTSMAAPHVSGVAALMKSVDPDLNASSFSYALENGLITDLIGGSSSFGNGLINAHKAVAWASGSNDIPDSLYYFPQSFSFFNDAVNAKLYLSNPGNGSVIVSGITPSEADASWLDVRQDDTDSNGLGIYTVEINSAAIPVNTFKKGSLIIEYQINDGAVQTASLDVIASNTISGNESVGNLYISLIALDEVLNALPEEPIFATSTVAGSLSDGVYSYRFENIPVGEYFVRASTNNDGDERSFDDGEAKGIYPNYYSFETLNANREVISGIDFSVQFFESNIEALDVLEIGASHYPLDLSED